MSYSSEVLADSPRAFWRLNESSGSPVDSSGNSKTITFTASPTQESTGGPGSGDGAVLLNGTTQFLTSDVSMNDSDYTIELWYKGTANTGVLADCRGNTTGLYAGLGTPPVGSNLNGAPFIGVSASGVWRGRRSTSVVVNDGAWHHLAFVWDGTSGSFITTSQFTVYIDGVAVAMTDVDYAGQNAPVNSGTDVFKFGHDLLDTAWLAGRLSNVALYNTPLSSGRVAAHYAALSGGATVTPPAATATAAAVVPVVSASRVVLPPAATATALAVPPTIGAGGNATVSPPAATATATALAPTITQVLSAGTDTSNSLNGRRRRARASVVVTTPAAVTPSRAAVKYDKSVPYPPPTLVNGRPT